MRSGAGESTGNLQDKTHIEKDGKERFPSYKMLDTM